MPERLQPSGVNRRSVLVSAAALLGASAGCLDGSRADGATTTTASGPSLSVSFDRLQPGVVVETGDGPRIISDGRQYLFARVEVTDGDPPARLDFAFRLGGRVYSPGVDAGALHPAMWPGDRYDPESGAGWLVFDLPVAGAAGHAALSLTGREWPVAEAIRERLAAAPPELSVEWTATAADAGEVQHEFAVSNPGSSDARFVGLVTVVEAPDSALAAFSRRVPAGETVSWTATTTDTGPAASYRLAWPGGERMERA
jgi:hypothetical protein